MLTKHALLRIRERTRMTSQDVHEIIQAEAMFPLGTAEGFDYALFWSPFDRQSKIAVLKAGTKVLVSVWEKDFHLPNGVQKVNKSLMRKARKAFNKFVFRRIKFVKESETKERRLQIEVKDGNKVVYTHDAGVIQFTKQLHRNGLVQHLKDLLSAILETIDQHSDKHSGAVSVSIWILHPDGKEVAIQHSFGIALLRNKLESLK